MRMKELAKCNPVYTACIKPMLVQYKSSNYIQNQAPTCFNRDIRTYNQKQPTMRVSRPIREVAVSDIEHTVAEVWMNAGSPFRDRFVRYLLLLSLQISPLLSFSLSRCRRVIRCKDRQYIGSASIRSHVRVIRRWRQAHCFSGTSVQVATDVDPLLEGVSVESILVV